MYRTTKQSGSESPQAAGAANAKQPAQQNIGGADACSETGPQGILRETEVPNLFVLPAGPPVAGATNLLYSPRLKECLGQFMTQFDMILIDTPPMLTIPDARVMGRSGRRRGVGGTRRQDDARRSAGVPGAAA